MNEENKGRPHPEVEKIARELIGKAIVILMDERKMGVRELVERTGVSSKQITELRLGKGNPTMSTFIKVLQVLDGRIEIMAKDPERTFPEMKLRRN